MKLLLALLPLAIASMTQAEPLRLEAQAGGCKYGLAENGVWRNTNYPTDIDRRDTCYQLGLSRIEKQYDLGAVGWRLSYVNLGSLTADNQFAMQDEQQFEKFNPKYCNIHTGKNCVGRGVMSQRTWGVSGTGIIERSYADFTFGAEAGVFAYYSVFDVTVLNVPSEQYLGAYHWGGWNATPVLGLNARYGYLTAAVRYYGSIRASEGCPGCEGITAGPTWGFLLGLQIPLQ